MAQAQRPRLTVAQMHTPLTTIPTLADALGDVAGKVGVHNLLTQFAQRADGRTWDSTVPRRRSRKSSSDASSPRTAPESPKSPEGDRSWPSQSGNGTAHHTNNRVAESAPKPKKRVRVDEVARALPKRLKRETDLTTTEKTARKRLHFAEQDDEVKAEATEMPTLATGPSLTEPSSRGGKRPLIVFSRLFELQNSSEVAEPEPVESFVQDQFGIPLLPPVPPSDLHPFAPVQPMLPPKAAAFPSVVGPVPQPGLGLPIPPIPSSYAYLDSTDPRSTPLIVDAEQPSPFAWVGSADVDDIIKFLRAQPRDEAACMRPMPMEQAFPPSSFLSPYSTRSMFSPMLDSPFRADSYEFGVPLLRRHMMTPMSASSSHPSSPYASMESEAFFPAFYDQPPILPYNLSAQQTPRRDACPLSPSPSTPSTSMRTPSKLSHHSTLRKS